MAKKAKNENKAKAKKTPKQSKLPGVVTDRPVVNGEVEAAAEDYRAARDERMAQTEVEAEMKTALEAAMKKHKLEEYVYVVDDEETGEPRKLRVAYEEETATSLTVRTVKDKKAKPDKAAA